MTEIWKEVPGYDRYEVSDKERIKTKESGKIREWKGKTQHIGLLDNENKPKKMFFHRLVALAFIPNPDKLPQVDHINKDRTDCRVCNLR